MSIGLPVYNGEKYLEEAIRSVLAQSYSDFDLIISDNGSTDGTREICERFARGDERIRYVRSAQNRGAAWNFCRVFELATGELFKWAAHDDVLAPGYLAACVAQLDADPSLVICHSQTREIDALGHSTGSHFPTVGAAARCERFRRALDTTYPLELFGVIRSSVLRETSLIGPHPQADIDLLLQLVLRGNVGQVGEILFARRSHSETYTEGMRSYGEALCWMDPSRRTPYVLYCAIRFWQLNALILRAPIDGSSRIRCVGLLLARSSREVVRRMAHARRPTSATGFVTRQAGDVSQPNPCGIHADPGC